ncbi:MAG: ankyrin repeat domain-containing protein [Flaviramulus sp.]|nr:ankyrin repeat domain-containing protein [Flaviramulus sp.]NNC49765.1 ankyrin repeat domain-containing protein [Flaviramulus sp.]
MKKTIIISAIALCFTMANVNAKTNSNDINSSNVEYFFKVNSFCVSIAKGDLETVQKLIARGADVNEKSNGMTPIMYAAKFNRTEILRLLITHGADLKAKSDKRMTALKYAELHGAEAAAAIIKEALMKKKNNYSI